MATLAPDLLTPGKAPAESCVRCSAGESISKSKIEGKLEIGGFDTCMICLANHVLVQVYRLDKLSPYSTTKAQVSKNRVGRFERGS